MKIFAWQTQTESRSIPLKTAIAGARTAPWWHTILVLLPLCASSLAGAPHHGLPSFRLFGIAPRLSAYFLALAEEWLVALIIWLWLRFRHLPLGSLVHGNRRGPRSLFRDLGIAIGFLIVEMPLTTGLSRLLHLDFDATAMFPHSTSELAVWMAMAMTAGYCEELIFRGYLMHQFASWTRSPVLAIALQGIIFGLVHGYQGTVMIIIVLIGWLFGALAWWRGSLLPGMFAHGVQDTLGGILGFISR
jgi:membrane protease YdiL (CAAX protease family)